MENEYSTERIQYYPFEGGIQDGIEELYFPENASQDENSKLVATLQG